MRGWLAAFATAAATAAQAAPGDVTPLDDFGADAAHRWAATASDQVEARWLPDAQGKGMCLAYDFHGVAGYAVARRALPALTLPADYEFRLRLHGSGPPNHFQFKLIDASAENVWWVQQRDVRLGPASRELRLKRRQIQFAWGPATDKTLRSPHALELAVATGSGGGQGRLCFERLELVERSPAPSTWPAPQVSAGADGVDIELGGLREFSGLQLRWPQGVKRPADYAVEGQSESGPWHPLAVLRRAAGPLDALYLPDAEARRLRLKPLDSAASPGPWATPGVELAGPSQWTSVDDATRARAAAYPPGTYPRTYRGEQNYWTVFGVDGGGRHTGLLSEDGAVEPLPGSPSIEPFVLLPGSAGRAGRLVSWADVKIEHSLPEGYLPLPRARWIHPEFTLDIEATATGRPGVATGMARYTLRPRGRRALQARLLLVTRPWQVNPPQQFLNRPGGASPLYTAGWSEGELSINGAQLALRPFPAPRRVHLGGGAALPVALALAHGDKLQALDEDDELAGSGNAEVALDFALAARAGGEAHVAVTWPMAGEPEPLRSKAQVDQAFRDAAAAWRERLNRVAFTLPAPARRVHDTLRSAVAQILLSRDGPALQPGTRSYARSWVRDGAMMVAGLLRLGEQQAAREFVDWYATKLFPDGKVPCCVDVRGADPVPENDSHGEFIFAVAELWRFTHDREALQRHWPAVERAARYMDGLRQSERTAANRQPGREALFGLMPASISHEGYSDKPMHSYWDDFWALRGYKDAVVLAQAAGNETAAREFTAWRDEFASELTASIRAAAAQHRIGFIPGAAELGDFDPTSTTVALNPAQVQGLLPDGMLDATFERYWRESEQRRRGEKAWRDYTPYELRSVGALVRMKQHERALVMLDFFFADQRPAGWNQWAEVVMRDPREPHFLGDMPHAWVASDAIRSLLDLFVHDADDGDTLVLGAGLPEAWLKEGVAVRGLATRQGSLSYRLKRTARGLKLDIDAGLTPPPGGLRITWARRQHRIDRLPFSAVLED
ncbi:hypothetical protein [Ideonella sp. YS5]|uniref:hypothetical protein n=1 Tax=Ideonella sp. YS5 TaxID=3453714 RepID=UPI003EEA7A8D